MARLKHISCYLKCLMFVLATLFCPPCFPAAQFLFPALQTSHLVGPVELLQLSDNFRRAGTLLIKSVNNNDSQVVSLSSASALYEAPLALLCVVMRGQPCALM